MFSGFDLFINVKMYVKITMGKKNNDFSVKKGLLVFKNITLTTLIQS